MSTEQKEMTIKNIASNSRMLELPDFKPAILTLLMVLLRHVDLETKRLLNALVAPAADPCSILKETAASDANNCLSGQRPPPPSSIAPSQRVDEMVLIDIRDYNRK